MTPEGNKMEYLHKIESVDAGSIAEELDIEPGDVLVSVNGKKVEDIFDYRYLCDDEKLLVVIRKPDGEEWELEIEKDPDEDLGIGFGGGLMSEYRSCRNHCIFCFVNQMPKGMRDTLYFHDDDARLSFLQGNYITMTNMSDHDIDRIILYHLEPINISFHTMNPELRKKMLHNRFAGDIMPKVMRLKKAGIRLNGQIVLCKGWNDGEDLEHSLKTFEQLLPELESVSVVPVGMTKFRDENHQVQLEPFKKEDAAAVIDQIERWQNYYFQKYGTHLVHASDEWYILADRPLPPEDNYDGYQQLENGVGMVRLLIEETRASLAQLNGDGRHRKAAIATGKLAAPYLAKLVKEIQGKFPNISCRVIPIRNDFFGEMITVSGLITGSDLKKQLRGQELGEELLLPVNMFRAGEQVFLDDVTVQELEQTLQIKVRIVKSTGQDFVHAVIGDQEQ
ncbi:DUF512 domain-containing protein [Lachnospiraceae bacterium Oil+RF-744-WCA-WT-11]|uniref:DUF512 domain-containing protein n=2 Tax=Porcincola intestinalis TaxID=2606632 RepID=A0A6L5X878_9FIRM|nr:DUF512 domain-containing protein [Porcincola intestinalis]